MSVFENSVDLTDVPESDWRSKYVGPGYRNCCYLTNHERNGTIVLFGYDHESNPQTFICPHKSWIKYRVKYPTKEQDVFGNYLETRYFKNSKERKNYLDRSGNSFEVVECFKPEQEFLHKMFDNDALDESFNNQPMRTFFFDIETEISDEGFEYASTARQRINMITIYDTLTEKYYTWSLQKVEPIFEDEYDEDGNLVNECPLKNTPRDRFVIFYFNDDEKAMFRHFLNWWENNFPDILVGFNSQSFDNGYLINRIERVLGDPKNVDEKTYRFSHNTCRLSPVGRVSARKNNIEGNERANKGAEEIYSISGIFLCDTLVLYRDKFKINQPLDGGNGLDNIGEVEVGVHKVHYKNTKVKGHPVVCSLKELYLKDFQRFYMYNVMDVEVLRLVEKKVKTINLARSIVSTGLCNYDAIYSSIGYLIGSLSMYSKVHMERTMISYSDKKNEKIPYEGAFVFEPVPGLYTGGICTVDFNSLYPSVIRAMNISVETYVGKISRFKIEDPTSEFFAKEPPIDLDGKDMIGDVKTESDVEYMAKYKTRFDRLGVEDKDLEDFYILASDGTTQKMITRKQLDALLRTKCIFTRNNTLFLKHSVKQGVISSWCRHFYSLRKSTKKSMQKLEMDVYNGAVPEDKIDQTKEKIDNLNNRQQSIKIMINSIYGCLGTSHSPIYNAYTSQSVTRMGRFCNITCSKHIRNVFSERYGIDDNYISTVSGDTDSFYNKSFIKIKY